MSTHNMQEERIYAPAQRGLKALCSNSDHNFKKPPMTRFCTAQMLKVRKFVTDIKVLSC